MQTPTDEMIADSLTKPKSAYNYDIVEAVLEYTKCLTTRLKRVCWYSPTSFSLAQPHEIYVFVTLRLTGRPNKVVSP